MIVILKLIRIILNMIPYRFGLKIGSGIGLLGYHLDKRHRKLAISNIKRALRVTARQARIIAKKSFQNLGENITAFFIQHIGPVQVTGREYINEDKSNIFILGHFGNWELLGRLAAANGFRLTAVGRSIKDKKVDRFISDSRFNSGLEILDKKGSFRSLLAALKNGKSAAILIDQYAGRRGVFVDFFGIPTSTISSPVLLALRTGCSIIPVFIISSDIGHKIIIEPPIQIVKSGNISRDIKVNTQLLVKPLERYVRQYPEQWWWVHRRWRNQ